MVGRFSRMIVAMTIRMPRWFVGWVSRRYVAGADLKDAVKVMHRLSKEDACFTIDVLGEDITSMDEATFFLEEYKRVITAISKNNFDANLSKRVRIIRNVTINGHDNKLNYQRTVLFI